MTRPKQATEQGLTPHYKVRVVLPGAMLHLASSSEPVIQADGIRISADWMTDPAYGDTIGLIKWDQVVAVTWRFAS